MTSSTTWTSPEHRRSVLWVVALATIAIVFDGYDLVVYGTVLPTLSTTRPNSVSSPPPPPGRLVPTRSSV